MWDIEKIGIYNMSMNIQQDSLFKSGYPIKYISAWDNLFKRDRYSGVLNFYDGNPKYIVNVEIFSEDRENLQEDQILIITGEHHNDKDILEYIENRKEKIISLCKKTGQTSFALDLERMKILENSDFYLFLPINGLNTFFIFENIPFQFFCIVNPTRNIKNSDFLSWLVSYIYSTVTCLTPRNKIEDFAKQFMQGISSLCVTKGNKKAINISTNLSILNCDLNDVGEDLLPVPGKTDRFEQLVEKSLTQMAQKGDKKKGKKK